MAIFVLRHLGISRREAGLMPAWERELLVDSQKRVMGIGQPAAAEAQGGFSADEIAMMTTPGLGA